MDPKPRRADENPERMRRAEKEVGENLPDEIHGVEGADVGRVTRHREEDEGSA